MKKIIIGLIVLPFISIYSQKSIIISNGGYETIETFINKQTSFLGYAFSINQYEVCLFQWDFNNDGVIDYNSTNNGNTEFTYSSAGTYKAILKVTNSNNESEIVSIKVVVKEGDGAIIYKPYDFAQGGGLKSAKIPDGSTQFYSLIIAGPDKSHKNMAFELYAVLKYKYSFTDDKIILLTTDKTDGDNQSNPLINDYLTRDKLTEKLNYLSNILDADDQLLVSIYCHGSGYQLNLNTVFTDQDGNYYLMTNFVSTTGTEDDYLESNFKMRGIVLEADYNNFTYCPLNQWRFYNHSEGIDNYTFRVKYLSHYTNLTFDGIPNQSNNDVFIEEIHCFAKGDANRDGIKQTYENFNYDNDDITLIDPVTKVFDEDDWDNTNLTLHRTMFGTMTAPYTSDWKNIMPCAEIPSRIKYVMFDKDLDNKLDIDINALSLDNLVADATDFDNDGVFDRFDINEDGDFNDWVSIEESIDLGNGEIYFDNDFHNLLTNNEANIMLYTSSCFGGGILDDISGYKRIGLSGASETSFGGPGGLPIEKALGDNSIDINGDGKVSVAELFNTTYLKYSNLDWIPQYDDNGDGISFSGLIPGSNEGCYGSKMFIGKPNEYFCNNDINDILNLSGIKSGETRYEDAFGIISSENISNSTLRYDALSIKLTTGFKVSSLNSSFTAKGMVNSCCFDGGLKSAVYGPSKSSVKDESVDTYMPHKTTEVPSIIGDGSISIYPNPVSLDLTVSINTFEDAEMKIDIFNCTGLLIESRIIGSSSGSIDMAGFSNGIYFIKVASGNKIVTKKIVKE